MSFDFSIPPRVAEWRDRITGFADDVVIPPVATRADG